MTPTRTPYYNYETDAAWKRRQRFIRRLWFAIAFAITAGAIGMIFKGLMEEWGK